MSQYSAQDLIHAQSASRGAAILPTERSSAEMADAGIILSRSAGTRAAILSEPLRKLLS